MELFILLTGNMAGVRIKLSQSLRFFHVKGSTDPVYFYFFDRYRHASDFRSAGAGSGNASSTPKIGQRSKAEDEEDDEGAGQRLPAMADRGRHLHHLSGRAQRFPSTGYQRRARTIH